MKSSIKSANEIISEANRMGTECTPFLLLVDFEMKSPQLFRLDEIGHENIKFDFNGISNHQKTESTRKPELTVPEEPLYSHYKNKISRIQKRMMEGDAWLINLTCETEILLNSGLSEIYRCTQAKYKMLYENKFVFFSPETFIKIKENRISAYPMKGTIRLSDRNSLERLMDDGKELAEHLTVVDLLRNDLSIVSKNVRVEKFRYPDLIRTDRSLIWQTSSVISGELNPDWKSRIGDIIFSLLPAGSISGAPKKKCVEIIKSIEDHNRGFYTGAAVLFDGRSVDSAVMIRFIEKKDSRFFYKSGGGITIYSRPEDEFTEMKDKIYVPCK